MESSYILKDSLIPLVNYLSEDDFDLDILTPGSHTLMHIDLSQKNLEIVMNSISDYDLQLLGSLDDIYRPRKLRSAIADMLMLSGFLPPRGIDELLSVLLGKSSESRELAICLDTNILFNRILSQYVLPRLLRTEKSLNILIPRQVEAEVGSNLSRDVKRTRNLSKILQALRESEMKLFFKVYGAGAPSLEARKAAMAIHELGVLERYRGLIKIYRSSELVTPGLRPDFLIVNSCKRIAEENSFELLILTMDEDTRTCARMLRCNVVKLIPQTNFPYLIENLPLINISELLYVAAMSLGFIRLRVGAAALELIGSWSGKSFEEWKQGKLLLRYPKISILSKHIRRVLKADSIFTALRMVS